MSDAVTIGEDGTAVLYRYVIVPADPACIGKKTLVTYSTRREAKQQIDEFPSMLRDRFRVRRAKITLFPS